MNCGAVQCHRHLHTYELSKNKLKQQEKETVILKNVIISSNLIFLCSVRAFLFWIEMGDLLKINNSRGPNKLHRGRKFSSK